MKENAHILITGFVQGVGFRQFVKRMARKLLLTGWVRNLPDGSVEAVISGPKKDIERLVEHANKGPFLSEVHTVTVSYDQTGEEFKEFFIKLD